MSYKALEWLREIDPARCDAGAYRVLSHLCFHHNDQRSAEQACFPTQATLSKRAGLSTAALNRALSRLEAAGLIVRRRGSVPGCRMQRTYFLLGCDGATQADQTRVDAAASNSHRQESDAEQTRVDASATNSRGQEFDNQTCVDASPSKSRAREFNVDQTRVDARSNSRGREEKVKKKYLTTTDQADDAEALERRCLEACGPGLCEQSRAVIGATRGVIPGWIAEGADLELHILPVLAQRTSKPQDRVVRSWGYFTAAVRETIMGRRAHPAVSQNAVKQHVSAGASESDPVLRLASWINTGRYVPTCAVTSTQRDALLARGLVTRDQLRALQIY